MDPLAEHDPQHVGPYRLLGRLGAGGMGQVYLGGVGDRLVAVKIVHPGLAHDERFRSRFRREVEISRQVTGPWVAAVVDADPDAATPWLATQYVDGPSLAAAVEADGPLAPGRVHVLANDLAMALAAVHRAGLVHRDLKPSNVLLGSDHSRLIDFGISRAVEGTRITSTGVVVGTPAFMSPEQIAGEEVGTASDVFSLGSVLAYAATGRSPFGDQAPVVLMLRITSHEPDLDGLPDGLREPIAACLAKRPEDRPTATELSGMLGPVAAGGHGAPPTEVDPLGTVLDVPTEPGNGPPAPDPPQGAALSRRVVLIGIGIAGLVSAGGLGLAATVLRGDRWTVPVPLQSDVAAAAVDERTLYLHDHDGDGAVLALDSETGAERWSVPGWARAEGSSGAVAMIPAGEALVIGTEAVVAALDTATGRRRWEVPRSVGPWRSDVAVTDGVAVATTVEGLVALDIGTGNRLWTADIGDQSAPVGLVAQNGRCFARNGESAEARDLRTGQQLWSGSRLAVLQMVGAGDVVVVHTGPQLFGLDAATGDVRWSIPLQRISLTASWRTLAAVGDLVLCYGANELGRTGEVFGGELAAFAPANGDVRWSVSSPDWAVTPALVGADDLVYVVPSRGTQRAYDVASSRQVWAFERVPSGGFTVVAARGRVAYLYGGSPGQRQVQAVTVA